MGNRFLLKHISYIATLARQNLALSKLGMLLSLALYYIQMNIGFSRDSRISISVCMRTSKWLNLFIYSLNGNHSQRIAIKASFLIDSELEIDDHYLAHRISSIPWLLVQPRLLFLFSPGTSSGLFLLYASGSKAFPDERAIELADLSITRYAVQTVFKRCLTKLP